MVNPLILKRHAGNAILKSFSVDITYEPIIKVPSCQNGWAITKFVRHKIRRPNV